MLSFSPSKQGVIAEVVIRGDWDGFALYLEEPGSLEPGEFVAVFNTLTGAARARAEVQEAMARLSSLREVA